MNTADGVLAIDRQQRIVRWNRAAERLLGFKAEEMLGRRCHDMIAGCDDLGRLVCHGKCSALMRGLREDPTPTHDLCIRTKGGQEIWVSVTTVLVPSRRKDACFLVHLFRDVSRQKEIERLIQRLLSNVAKLSSSPGTDSAIPSPLSSLSMDHLTGREREVLHLLASGASTREIAQNLFISLFTARNHIQKVLAKLKVHSRLEAAILALRNGLR